MKKMRMVWPVIIAFNLTCSFILFKKGREKDVRNERLKKPITLEEMEAAYKRYYFARR